MYYVVRYRGKEYGIFLHSMDVHEGICQEILDNALGQEYNATFCPYLASGARSCRK